MDWKGGDGGWIGYLVILMGGWRWVPWGLCWLVRVWSGAGLDGGVGSWV